MGVQPQRQQHGGASLSRRLCTTSAGYTVLPHPPTPNTKKTLLPKTTCAAFTHRKPCLTAKTGRAGAANLNPENPPKPPLPSSRPAMTRLMPVLCPPRPASTGAGRRTQSGRYSGTKAYVARHRPHAQPPALGQFGGIWSQNRQNPADGELAMRGSTCDAPIAAP